MTYDLLDSPAPFAVVMPRAPSHESALQAPAEEKLARAALALDGLSVGDGFGESYFGAGDGAVAQQALNPGPWPWTDDTLMAMSIVEVLRRHGQIEPDALAKSFGVRYEPYRGYGPAMHDVLPSFAYGVDWRAASQSLFYGQGSFGNGSAMRVAPIGGYFAEDLERCAQQAVLSAEVTHAHPEAHAGAVATAIAAALATRRRLLGPAAQPEGRAFIEAVIAYTPPGEVHDALANALDIEADAPIGEVVARLGNGNAITCQDTVPFVCYCAAHHLDDYPGALWRTVCGYGDMDTTCAMVGGIVACSVGETGIPQEWRQRREPLPRWPFE